MGAEEDEPLDEPEWNITLNHTAAEEGVAELLDDYEAWTAREVQIMNDWTTDRQLVDEYYWTYEMEPHLKKGEKLDEKTIRSIVTYVANSTTIKGRPLIEVYPDIEEYMMHNF